MIGSSAQNVSAGARVKVRDPGAVPLWSTWDNDNQRTSTPVKRRLQQLFFSGDKKIQAEVVYISSETERERLKRDKRVKVALRDPAGSQIVITADVNNLKSA
ncbi:MAG: hypothetical protein AB7Q17_17880 [Phycisphaerae bacterium]